MPTFRTLTSHLVAVPRDDIDTDQIIPARFLKTTSKRGLEAHLFADWRYGEGGAPRPEFPLHAEGAKGAQILLAGRNFGCGSSREHAPWALVAYGFRAIVARSFADIFSANALRNGLLPVAVSAEVHAALLAEHAADPRAALTIDLPSQTLGSPGGVSASFEVPPFARHCLLEGVDELGYLLAHEKEIAAHEARHG